MQPVVSVVVPSHDRPLRLRWLLNALEDQTMSPDRFEIVVVHDSAGPETAQLLDDHPLRTAGRLRCRQLPAGTGKPGHQRNVGWRLAEAPLIAFTDDDCRPEPGWLETLVRAAGNHPGSLVQGRTRPDPFELDLMRSAHARSIEVDPPGPFAQTCNILYPRDALERIGGFAEDVQLTSGEDTDAAMRAGELGFGVVGERDAVVNHAVEAFTLVGALRITRKWADLAYVVRRHPVMRGHLALRLFWRPSHPALLLAIAGGVAGRRHRLALVAAAPYLWMRFPHRPRPLAIAKGLVRLPGTVVIDCFEVLTCLRGSIRHRTPFL
jgi:glycosyltransferase involved in cell wall biosynthesis